jgi:hypothetical protein
MHIDYIWGTRQTEQDQIITRTSQYWGSGKESEENNHYNYRELTTRHLAIASAPEVLWLLRAEFFRMNIKQFCRPRPYRRHFSSKWGSTSPSQTCHPIQTYHHGSTSLAASASSTPSVGGPALMSAPPHPIKKLSVPLSRVNYYLLSSHRNTRGCAFTSLPQIYSVTWWISFLRLWIYLPRLSEIIFFGSVDSSSSAYWILSSSDSSYKVIIGFL